MERLTKRDIGGRAYYPECSKTEFCSWAGRSDKCGRCIFDAKVCERLARYEDIDLTPKEIVDLKERDTAKTAIITGYNRAIGCKVGECPKCGTMARDYMNFCNDCGQRLKWED